LDAGRFHAANVFTQTCEISGEYRWENLQHEVLKNESRPVNRDNRQTSAFICRKFQTLFRC
jgi:hypothetical protein